MPVLSLFLTLALSLATAPAFAKHPAAETARARTGAAAQEPAQQGMVEVARDTATPAGLTKSAQAPPENQAAGEGGPEMTEFGRQARILANACADALDHQQPLPPGCGVVDPAEKLHTLAPLVPQMAAFGTGTAAPSGNAFVTDGASGNSVQPSDAQIAAGPNNLLIATNNTLRAYSKTGVALNSSQTLESFFGSSDSVFDPRVLFHPYIQRFFVIAITRNNSSLNSKLWLAMSTGADATGPWTKGSYTVSNDEGLACDYPAAGFDLSRVYVTCNMVTFGSSPTFQHAVINSWLGSELLANFSTAMRRTFGATGKDRKSTRLNSSHRL